MKKTPAAMILMMSDRLSLREPPAAMMLPAVMRRGQGRSALSKFMRFQASGNNTGMCHKRDLTDQQWKILDPLVPAPARRRDGRGRPWKERRAVLNGILWVLRTGAPWVELPDRYASYQTCHRRFQQWVQSGVMRGILEALAVDCVATKSPLRTRRRSKVSLSVSSKGSLNRTTHN
jgi:transposase